MAKEPMALMLGMPCSAPRALINENQQLKMPGFKAQWVP